MYLLMDNGATVDLETSDAKTALIHAAANERTAAIRALIERGAQPDRESADGITPLLAAAISGKLQPVAALVRTCFRGPWPFGKKAVVQEA
jgi:ankyrin repeat protein